MVPANRANKSLAGSIRRAGHFILSHFLPTLDKSHKSEIPYLIRWRRALCAGAIRALNEAFLLPIGDGKSVMKGNWISELINMGLTKLGIWLPN
jgi:hypothetical protein